MGEKGLGNEVGSTGNPLAEMPLTQARAAVKSALGDEACNLT